MTGFLSKNLFTNYTLKNRFTIKMKMVHAKCRNIKVLLKVILLFFFFLTCLHKRGGGGFELVTSALLGMVLAY
jgi:hypothetical protein